MLTNEAACHLTKNRDKNQFSTDGAEADPRRDTQKECMCDILVRLIVLEFDVVIHFLSFYHGIQIYHNIGPSWKNNITLTGIITKKSFIIYTCSE